MFTPHLAPMNRGILATCYARPPGSRSTAELLDCLHDAYDDEPFVVVTDGSPSTKATLGPTGPLTARFDARTGGRGHRRPRQPHQGGRRPGLQCANLAGLPETTGLPVAGCTRDRDRPSRGVDVLAHAHERAGILVEALPYIRRFSGRPSWSSTAATP